MSKNSLPLKPMSLMAYRRNVASTFQTLLRRIESCEKANLRMANDLFALQNPKPQAAAPAEKPVDGSVVLAAHRLGLLREVYRALTGKLMPDTAPVSDVLRAARETASTVDEMKKAMQLARPTNPEDMHARKILGEVYLWVTGEQLGGRPLTQVADAVHRALVKSRQMQSQLDAIKRALEGP